ncbi:MAG: hypothetical protein ACLU8W_10935 [Clostridia bacterium]
MEGFSFESKSLGYGIIEFEICNYYDMGWAESSNFMEIEPNRPGQSITIMTTKGSITCYVSAYQKKDSENYIVNVNAVSIKRNRR